VVSVRACRACGAFWAWCLKRIFPSAAAPQPKLLPQMHPLSFSRRRAMLCEVSERVTRAGLGRGLGSLMGGTKEPRTPAPAPAAAEGPALKADNLSPGMAALVRGGGAVQSEGEAAPPRPVPSRGLKLIQVSLLLADILLVALAVRLVVKADGPLGFMGAALCVFAMALGAWLFWLASRVE